MNNKQQTINNKLQGDRGFTLVELIVSLGLFIVVMIISTGALLSLSDTNRKIQSMRIAMDNLNLALESISREMRMGIMYYCDPALPITLSRGNDCSVGTSVAFLSQDGNTTVYRINGTSIERSKDGGNNFSVMTASKVNIDNLSFSVSGTGAGSDQPRVVISIGGTAGDKITSSFKIQTMVTQRIPK